MKKQKFMKLSAFVSDPSLENSFSAPVSHSGEISVVFKGKNISIHGWDGSTWTTIYTWNSLDPQFKFDNAYQSYYLKSLTGSEEIMSVSFFSTDSITNSIPSLAGVDREVKFYDVEEVPVYRPSDVNKMLTIMSDGSLAWLLASESFVVPSEGEANMVGLEEDPSLVLYGNAQLIDGVLHVDGTSGTYASLPHSVDYDKGSGDLSVNLWFNANSLPNNWNAGLVSKMGGGWSGWITAISTLDAEDGTGLMPEGGLQTTTFGTGSGDKNDRSRVPGGVTLNTWHHVAFVMPAVGDFKMYFNGQEVHSYVPFIRNSSSSGGLRIGGWGPVNGYSGWFDGMIDGVFVEKKVLTAQEISDIHAAGRGESAPTQTYLEETATLYGDASISGGTLVLDGNGDYAVIDDGFRFTDVLSTSIWFKTTATGDRRIYSSHVRGMSGDDFRNGFFARLNNGQLKYRHPSGGTAELSGPSGLNDGQWHHMAVTWENNVGYTLYVDGSQVATGGAGASDGYVSGWGLYIGANPWLNNNPYGFFSGEVSKFEVLNEVLTAQDVSDRYNAGV